MRHLLGVLLVCILVGCTALHVNPSLFVMSRASFKVRSLSADDAQSVVAFLQKQKPSATCLRFLHEIHEVGPSVFRNRAWFSDCESWDETKCICQLQSEVPTRTSCSILAQDDQACFDMLCGLSVQGSIEWSKLLLAHFDVDLNSAAQRAASCCNASQPSPSSRYIFLPLIEPEKLLADPEIGNYRIRRLCSDDAEIVDATWRFRSEGSLSMIQGLIDRRASAALEAEGTPCAQGGQGAGEGAVGPAAAWILEYDNGSIGMLYTLDSARRRGYGRAVARALAAELSEAHAHGARGAPPYCFVAEDNSASLRLFESLGFAPRGTVAWVRFPPPANDPVS